MFTVALLLVALLVGGVLGVAFTSTNGLRRHRLYETDAEVLERNPGDAAA